MRLAGCVGALLATVVACTSGADEPDSRDLLRQSDVDERIRVLPADLDFADAPVWQPRTTLDPGWGEPADIAIWNTRIAVADPVTAKVYAFSGDSLMAEFGGFGEGPTEFVRPDHVRATAESIWVLDGALSRITRWSWDGQLKDSYPGIPVMSTEILLSADSLVGTRGLRDDPADGLWLEAGASLGRPWGVECRGLAGGYDTSVLFDCQVGAVVLNRPGESLRAVELGRSPQTMTPQERLSVRESMLDDLGEVAFDAESDAFAVLERQLERAATKRMWQALECVEGGSRCVGIYQQPDLVGPTSATVVVLRDSLTRFDVWRVEGPVRGATVGTDDVALLIEDPATGLLYLAVGSM